MKDKELAILRKVLTTRLPEPEVNKVVNEIKEATAPETDEKEDAGPKPKKVFDVLVSDPDGKLPDNLVCWVFQHAEDKPFQDLPEAIRRLAVLHNQPPADGRRRRRGKNAIKFETVGETLELIPTKALREEGFILKTKMPVMCLPVPNKLDLEKPISQPDSAEPEPEQLAETPPVEELAST